MPQMMPMSWLYFLLSVIFMLTVWMSMIFFVKNYSNSKKLLRTETSNHNWKW